MTQNGQPKPGKQTTWSCRRVAALLGGLVGITTIVGVAIAVLQLFAQIGSSQNEQVTSATQVSILESQLQVQRAIATLQSQSASAGEAERAAIATRVSELQATQSALDAILELPGSGSTDASPPSAARLLPFRDSFDTGPRSEWVLTEGEWKVTNGRLGAVPGGLMTLQLDAPLPDNYAITLDFEIWNAGLSLTVGRTIRFVFDRYRYVWEAYDQAGWKKIDELASGMNFTGGTLRFGVSDNTYTVDVGGQQIASIVYGDPASGSIALSVNPDTYIDNFAIVAP